jgi:hypothetical protein
MAKGANGVWAINPAPPQTILASAIIGKPSWAIQAIPWSVAKKHYGSESWSRPHAQGAPRLIVTNWKRKTPPGIAASHPNGNSRVANGASVVRRHRCN